MLTLPFSKTGTIGRFDVLQDGRMNFLRQLKFS